MNDTVLHPAVARLELPQGPWVAKEEQWGEEYYISNSHTNLRTTGENEGNFAIAVDNTAVPLFLASPEMLSWMVKDLTAIGMTDEEMHMHKRIGRDLIRRASNNKINL